MKTYKVVTRDQFVIQPMPELVIVKITELATRQGYSRGVDPMLEIPGVLEEEVDDALLPDMVEIDVRINEPEEPVDLVDTAGANTPTPPAGVRDLERVCELTTPADSYQPPLAAANLDQPPSNESGSPPPSRQLRSATRYASLAQDIVQGGPAHRGVRCSQRLSARAM